MTRATVTRVAEEQILDQARRLIREHALVRLEIDNEALEQARDRRSILIVLNQAGDNHSHWQSAESVQSWSSGTPLTFGVNISDGVIVDIEPEGPAAHARLTLGEHITIVSGNAWQYDEPLVISRTAEQDTQVTLIAQPPRALTLPTASRRGVVGQLTIPTLISIAAEAGQAYAARAHQLIAALHAQGANHWIIDLRQNAGGNMWPMLAAVGPILGEGTCGAFRTGSGSTTHWSYKAREARLDGRTMCAVPDGIEPIAPPPRVAVLTSTATGSSAEAVAIAFKGRPEARSFGQRTAGATTANDLLKLEDGSALFLAVAVEIDRTDVPYFSGVEPDQLTPIDWKQFNTRHDTTLSTAMRWLTSDYGLAREPPPKIG